MILLATWLVLQTQAKIQLNLDQALDWARDSSATTQLAVSREAEARAKESEATSSLLPTLTASATTRRCAAAWPGRNSPRRRC